MLNETNHEAELVRLSLDDERSAGIVVVKSSYDIDGGLPPPVVATERHEVLRVRLSRDDERSAASDEVAR
jgi:hypothetical protein